MKLDLPFQHLFTPQGNELTNWHDFYGAIRVLSDYSNTAGNHLNTLAYWNHGASFPIDTQFEDNVTFRITRSPLLPIWLHREDYAGYFQKSKNVHVIGQAYIYVPNCTQRYANSVLIMPGHTILPDSTINPVLFQRYVDEVSLVYPPNDRTFVCINTNCLRNGYWITEFSRAGYVIIGGSRLDDANSYSRMKMLFSAFETVVSNVLGSHIAYAAFEGCRVGIWGEHSNAFALGTAESFDYNTWRSSSETEYPFLFTDPGSESYNEDWGRFILGNTHKCTTAEIRNYLAEAHDHYDFFLRRSKVIRRMNTLFKRLINR